MLKRDITEDGKFRITETTMSFNDAKITVVVYSADLMEVQINDDPVRKTDQASRDWFEKVHRGKF